MEKDRIKEIQKSLENDLYEKINKIEKNQENDEINNKYSINYVETKELINILPQNNQKSKYENNNEDTLQIISHEDVELEIDDSRVREKYEEHLQKMREENVLMEESELIEENNLIGETNSIEEKSLIDETDTIEEKSLIDDLSDSINYGEFVEDDLILNNNEQITNVDEVKENKFKEKDDFEAGNNFEGNDDFEEDYYFEEDDYLEKNTKFKILNTIINIGLIILIIVLIILILKVI